MIKQLWPTYFMQDTMETSIMHEMIYYLTVECDFNKPPSDFGLENILDSKHPSVLKFKQQVIIPSFNKYLKNTINKQIDDWAGYKMKGWLAGTGNDYSLNYHNHRGAQISAVFYLLCEDHNKGGNIAFTDPRQNANRGYDENFTPWFNDEILKVKSGDIVVFPSFLYHFVSTYRGSMRLAMPVDLFLHTNS